MTHNHDKILQSKAEIDALREAQPLKNCAMCGKKLPRIQRELVTEPRERLVRQYKGFSGGETQYEEVGAVVQEIQGYKYVPAFHQYAPFCTLRCAEGFAYAAHMAGYRIKGRTGA